MPQRKFQFDLQPALDKARADQEDCEFRLAIATENLKNETKELRARRTRRAELRQRIRREHDNLTGASAQRLNATDLQAKCRYIEFLRQQVLDMAETIEEQRRRRDDARQILSDRREDLTQATAKAEALDKLRQRKKEEFQAELDHAEELEIEDTVIQRWVRDNKQ